MKFRKIVLLPLLLVALVSCGNRDSSSQESSASNPPVQESSASNSTSEEDNNNPTSQEGSASDSTSQGGGTSNSTGEETPVLPAEANERVGAAIEKVVAEPLKSIDLNVAVDAFAQRKLALLNSGEVTENDAIEVTANAAIKAKDLDQEDAQIAISGSAEATIFMQEEAFAAIDAEAGIYYDDNFIYMDLSLTQRDLALGQAVTNSQKGKMEVGPFPGLESILEELLGEAPLPEDLLEELPESALSLEDLLANIGTIEAIESDDVLTVKYEITTDDIIAVIVAMNQETLGSLSPEQYAAAVASLQAMITETLDLRKATITVEIDKNDVLTGLAIELDLDVMNQSYIGDETSKNMIAAIETITIRGSIDISLKINKDVTISFPDFTDYVLMDEEN